MSSRRARFFQATSQAAIHHMVMLPNTREHVLDNMFREAKQETSRPKPSTSPCTVIERQSCLVHDPVGRVEGQTTSRRPPPRAGDFQLGALLPMRPPFSHLLVVECPAAGCRCRRWPSPILPCCVAPGEILREQSAICTREYAWQRVHAGTSELRYDSPFAVYPVQHQSLPHYDHTGNPTYCSHRNNDFFGIKNIQEPQEQQTLPTSDCLELNDLLRS